MDPTSVDLFQGSAGEFCRKIDQKSLVGVLWHKYVNYFGEEPSEGLVLSWKNSLSATEKVLQEAQLEEQGVSLEFVLPMCSDRLDFMITGLDKSKAQKAVVIELKQWEEAKPCEDDDSVITRIDGAEREKLHPSIQAESYRLYLEGFLDVFYNDHPIGLESCSYLHNYEPLDHDVILDPKFSRAIKDNPVFCKGDRSRLASYLKERVGFGGGLDILEAIKHSNVAPSKKLLEQVSKEISTGGSYNLVGDQVRAYHRVLRLVEEAGKADGKKKVVIVKGGPGTGKSVIAINLLAALTKKGKIAYYVTGSGAFTKSYQEAVGGKFKGFFKYTNSFVADNLVTPPKAVADCLLIDEAHRLRQRAPGSGRFRFVYSGKIQIHELIDVCKVPVFFVDDDQIVRPGEVGTSSYIQNMAEEYGCEVEEPIDLTTEFRCSGDSGFIQWVTNALGIKNTANIKREKDTKFEFKIFDSPLAMENELKVKISEGNTARLVSGFVFPWSKKSGFGSSLPEEVVIGNYARPWNLREEIENYPDSNRWAAKPEGFGQIGCIYSAQGFEFDYVGVIFGDDLAFDEKKKRWVLHRENSKDPILKNVDSDVELMGYLRNIYRVLLTRGMKGCYVYFLNLETRKHFEEAEQ
jgi:DUF2075 family protein